MSFLMRYHVTAEALLLRRAKELSRCSLYEIVGYVLVRCRACYCVRKRKTTTGQHGIPIRGKYEKNHLEGFLPNFYAKGLRQ